MFLAILLLLHGHECRKVGLIIGEHQRGAVTLAGWNLQGQIDSPKGNRGERFPTRVPQHGVRHHDYGPPKHVGKDEDVEFFQALIHRLF